MGGLLAPSASAHDECVHYPFVSAVLLKWLPINVWFGVQPMNDVVRGALDAFGPLSWKRPEVTGYARVPMWTYLARSDVVSLDGRWRFRLRDCPEHVLDADLAGATTDWVAVEVPG